MTSKYLALRKTAPKRAFALLFVLVFCYYGVCGRIWAEAPADGGSFSPVAEFNRLPEIPNLLPGYIEFRAGHFKQHGIQVTKPDLKFLIEEDALRRVYLLAVVRAAIVQSSEAVLLGKLVSNMPARDVDSLAALGVGPMEKGEGLSEWLLRSLKTRGFTPIAVFSDKIANDPTQKHLSSLLQSQDVDIALWRLAETDQLEKSTVPALLYYLSQGGTIEGLGKDDMEAFQRIMKEAPSRFGSVFFGLEMAFPGHLLQLCRGGTVAGEKSEWLK